MILTSLFYFVSSKFPPGVWITTPTAVCGVQPKQLLGGEGWTVAVMLLSQDKPKVLSRIIEARVGNIVALEKQ